MLGFNYYNKSILDTITAFMKLFNNVYLTRDYSIPDRKDILVPIHFAQKDKILSRLEIEPDVNSKKAITLPILSAELTGFTYDAARNLQATQTIVTNTGRIFNNSSSVYR